jgi:hypothetical protein
MNTNRASSRKTSETRRRIRSIGASLAVIGMLFLTASCGSNGPGGNSDPAASAASSTGPSTPALGNHVTITADDYGLQTPNFYYSTDNDVFWSIQADIADDVHDIDFRCVIRIDIVKSGGSLPALSKTYALSPDPLHETFPGTLYVFNGHKSVMMKAEQGTISFASTNSESDIEGAFDVVITDYASPLIPAPQYRLAGTFGFSMGTYGPADPRPAEVFPSEGKAAYDRSCAACHALGKYDLTGESASDLSMRGGELPAVFPGSVTEHQELAVDPASMQALRIFLNAS